MKVIFISLIGLAALVLGGWNAAGQPAAQTPEMQTTSRQVVSVQEIVGRWHGFPTGVLLQFNDDGSAHFGLDWDGTEIGYEARIWFESQRLSILFTDFDGHINGCSTSVGLYNVDLHSEGTISFKPVHDDCQFRMEILGGAAAADFRMMYHPVKSEQRSKTINVAGNYVIGIIVTKHYHQSKMIHRCVHLVCI